MIADTNLDDRQKCQCAVALERNESDSFVLHRSVDLATAPGHLVLQHKDNSTSITVLDGPVDLNQPTEQLLDTAEYRQQHHVSELDYTDNYCFQN